jgi:hypothetical protein
MTTRDISIKDIVLCAMWFFLTIGMFEVLYTVVSIVSYTDGMDFNRWLFFLGFGVPICLIPSYYFFKYVEEDRNR